MIEPNFSGIQTPSTVLFTLDGGFWQLSYDEFERACAVFERGDQFFRTRSVDDEEVVIRMDQVGGVCLMTEATIERNNKRVVADAARKNAMMPL